MHRQYRYGLPNEMHSMQASMQALYMGTERKIMEFIEFVANEQAGWLPGWLTGWL